MSFSNDIDAVRGEFRMGRMKMSILILSSFLVAGVVVLGLLAHTLIKPENYKSFISNKVRQATGRELSFNGDMSVSFFPWLGLSARDVSLGNGKGFGPEPMVRFASVGIRVRFLPLLTGSVEIGQIELDGVNVLLQRNEKGRSNWDDLHGEKSQNAEADSVDKSAGAGALSKTFRIDGVSLRHVDLVWDDLQNKRKISVQNVQAELSDFSQGEKFDFSLRADMQGFFSDLASHVELGGKGQLDFGKKIYSATDVSGRILLSGGFLPEEGVDSDFSITGILAELEKHQVTADGVSISAAGLHGSGNVDLKMGKTIVCSGEMSLTCQDIRRFLSQVGISLPQTRDKEVLRSAVGTFSYTGSKDGLALIDVESKVDDSHISGNYSIRLSDQPVHIAEILVDTINLDRYLPPVDSVDMVQEHSGEAGRANNVFEIGKVWLRQAALTIRLAVKELVCRKVRISDMQGGLVVRNGRVAIDPLLFNAYLGSVDTVVAADISTDIFAYDVTSRVKGVRLGPLVMAVQGKESLQGTVDAMAVLHSEGDALVELKKALGGKVSFNLTDGVFPGVDISAIARTAKESSGKKTMQSATDDKTRFGSISGSATIAKGVAYNEDLQLKAPNLRAIGEGSVDIPSGSIDYLAKVKLVASSAGQGGSSYDSIPGIPVPVHVGGTLEKPSYFVNPAEYIRMLGTGVVDTVGGVVKGVGGLIQSILPNSPPDSKKGVKK